MQSARAQSDRTGDKPRPGAISSGDPEDKPADEPAVLRATDLAPPVQITAAGRPIDIEGFAAPFMGDFDGDGRTDILTGAGFGRLYLFRRNQDGTFAEAEVLENKHGELQMGRSFPSKNRT